MAIEGNGDPPVLDLRTIEELCQPSLNGRGGPITPIAIQAMKFGLKNDMIQQVQNSFQFHGLPGDDANKHLDKFLHVTQSIKVNGGASHGPNPPPAYQAPGYQASVHQPLIPQPQVMTNIEFTNYMKANDAILKNMQTNITSLINSNLELKNMFGQFIKMNTTSSSGSRTLPSNTITNPKEDLKGITTRSGTANQGPTIPTTSSSPPKVVKLETPIPNSEPVVAPVIEPVVAPGDDKLPVIIAKDLKDEEKTAFIKVLKSQKRAIAWKLYNIKEVDAFLDLKDDPTSSEVDHSYLNTEGDILLLEAFLNDDPSLPPPTQGNNLPKF
nr:reverse transcriptase domain-containing protein [Tanacetum cinerariifolium]